VLRPAFFCRHPVPTTRQNVPGLGRFCPVEPGQKNKKINKNSANLPRPAQLFAGPVLAPSHPEQNAPGSQNGVGQCQRQRDSQNG
jgi:hypothetical protein